MILDFVPVGNLEKESILYSVKQYSQEYVSLTQTYFIENFRGNGVVQNKYLSIYFCVKFPFYCSILTKLLNHFKSKTGS